MTNRKLLTVALIVAAALAITAAAVALTIAGFGGVGDHTPVRYATCTTGPDGRAVCR